MKKQNKTSFRVIKLFSAFLFLFCFLSGSFKANAAEYTFDSDFIKIEVEDNVLVMTPNTAKSDEVWEKAGISDPSDTIDDFKDMGVIVSLYEPESALTVNCISNRSSQTVEFFTFAEASDYEIIDFVNSVMADSLTEGMTLDVTVDRGLNTFPFFRMVIDATSTETPCLEVVYGTIINGEMLQFDTYLTGSQTVDESFLKKVVSKVSFTRIMTPEEYEIEVAAARRQLILVFAGLFVIIASLISLSVLARRRKDKRAKKISDAIVEFRQRLSQGLISPDAEPKYTVETQYNEEMFEHYGMYRAWIKFESGFIIGIVIFIAIIALMLKSGAYLYSLILLVFFVTLLYLHYSLAEKNKDAMIKRYEIKSRPHPVFRFYDDFFKVTGLPTAGEYIYKQVTSVASFKGDIYIFVGDSQVLILRKADLKDCSYSQLKALIKGQ